MVPCAELALTWMLSVTCLGGGLASGHVLGDASVLKEGGHLPEMSTTLRLGTVEVRSYIRSPGCVGGK